MKLYTQNFCCFAARKTVRTFTYKVRQGKPIANFFLWIPSILLFFLFSFNVTFLYFIRKKFVTPGAQAFHSTWGLGR